MAAELPTLTVPGRWEDLLGKDRDILERLLPDYFRQRRWFGGKTRTIRSIALRKVFPVSTPASPVFYTLAEVEYVDGLPDFYALPLTVTAGPQAKKLLQDYPHGVVAHLKGASSDGFLVDALVEPSFHVLLLDAIAHKQTFRHDAGEIRASALRDFASLRSKTPLPSRIVGAEQSNTSIIFGDRMILKCFRRLEEGTNLDLEIGSYLTEAHFLHSAPVLGAIEYRRPDLEPVTLAVLHGFVPNQGDAWSYMLKELSEYYKTIVVAGSPKPELPLGDLLDLAQSGKPPEHNRYFLGDAKRSAVLLGERTAQLHLALAQGRDPAFAPEPFNLQAQQALHRSVSDLHSRVFALLKSRFADLPETVQGEARHVLDQSVAIPSRLERILQNSLTGLRIRCHGDYHLGQVLFTGQDFVIIDFEGEPARPLAQRRQKTSPLRDVAGMIRSFHYAAHCGLPPESVSLQPWAEFWYSWISAIYLLAYLSTACTENLLPASDHELKLLLDTFLLEKAMYELAYELNHRPDWVRIPLRGIAQLLEAS